MSIDVQQVADQITYFLWADEGEDGINMNVQGSDEITYFLWVGEEEDSMSMDV
jgi:hypothetical protein